MKHQPLLTVLPTGIGLPCLRTCLQSLNTRDRPGEVLVVLDAVGRHLAGLSTRPGGRPAVYAYGLMAEFPWLAGVKTNEHSDAWAITNQTLNIGFVAAQGRYVAITHEDVLYPWNFPWEMLTYHLKEAATRPDVVGVAWPCLLKDAGREELQFSSPEQCLIQGVPPVSCAISKAFWEEIGGFSETAGIWYDALLQAELKKRNRWLWYLPLPPVVHECSQGMRAIRWADDWKQCPLWEKQDENFEAVYGYPFRREEFAVKAL